MPIQTQEAKVGPSSCISNKPPTWLMLPVQRPHQDGESHDKPRGLPAWGGVVSEQPEGRLGH